MTFPFPWTNKVKLNTGQNNNVHTKFATSNLINNLFTQTRLVKKAYNDIFPRVAK